MSVAALSSAGFTEYVAASSNIAASQQALQALQQSLASGNLSAAQTAFNTYQALTQNLANSNGSVSSSNAQLVADLGVLGKAIASGDLAGSRAAFTAVQKDISSGGSPAVAAAEAAAAHTVTEIEGLLSSFTPGNTTSTTDPFTQILDSAYGVGSSSASSTTSSGPTADTTTNPTVDPIAALNVDPYPATGGPSAAADNSGLSVYA